MVTVSKLGFTVCTYSRSRGGERERKLVLVDTPSEHGGEQDVTVSDFAMSFFVDPENESHVYNFIKEHDSPEGFYLIDLGFAAATVNNGNPVRPRKYLLVSDVSSPLTMPSKAIPVFGLIAIVQNEKDKIKYKSKFVPLANPVAELVMMAKDLNPAMQGIMCDSTVSLGFIAQPTSSMSPDNLADMLEHDDDHAKPIKIKIRMPHRHP